MQLMMFLQPARLILIYNIYGNPDELTEKIFKNMSVKLKEKPNDLPVLTVATTYVGVRSVTMQCGRGLKLTN